MVKSVQFIKFIREIQTIPKNVLCIQGRFELGKIWTSLVYSKYMVQFRFDCKFLGLKMFDFFTIN